MPAELGMCGLFGEWWPRSANPPELPKFNDGTATGRSEGAFSGRPVTDMKQLRILEMRYGIIRAEALTPRETLAFIEQLLGET